MRAFFEVDNFRLKVASDDVCGLVIELIGMKDLVKFGDSRSNGSRVIQLPHFVTNEQHRRTPAIT